MKRVEKIIPIEIKEIDEEGRSFLAVASTEEVDRDGDTIKADGWDLANYLKNPVVPWAHDYSQPPVAKSIETFVEGGKLMFRPKFPTAEEYGFADTIWKLYKGGYLRAFSVGFWPKRREFVETEGRRGYDFIEQELWEISACVVPANAGALVAAKSAGIDVSSVEKTLEPAMREDGTWRGGLSEEEIVFSEEKAELVARFDDILKAKDERIDELQIQLAAKQAEVDALIEQLQLATLEEHEKKEAPPITRDELRRIVARAMGSTLAKAFERRLSYHLGKV